MKDNIIIEDVKSINSRLLVTTFMKLPVYRQYIILRQLEVLDASDQLNCLEDLKNAFVRVREQEKIRLLWNIVIGE